MVEDIIVFPSVVVFLRALPAELEGLLELRSAMARSAPVLFKLTTKGRTHTMMVHRYATHATCQWKF